MSLRHLFVASFAFALTACGPDSQLLADSQDVDTDEAVATTEGELTASSSASVWFPLATANSWVFESATGATRTVRVDSASGGSFLVSGLFPTATWVATSTSSTNTLSKWDDTASAWQSWMRFGFASTPWNLGFAACTGAKYRRSSTGVTASTAAGAFSDTRTISVEQVPSTTALCAPPAFTELTFAANVGLVAFRTGRGERFTLKSAVVGARRYPASNGSVTASVTLDKASYVSTPNTIRCITTPCPSNEKTAVARVTFTVTNGSSSVETWNFRTGCQFDVELVSASGLVVKRLSDERACTMALTSVTLGAGQSRTWSAEVALNDRDGLQLDGSYTARARLIPSASAASAPVASRAFTVRVQQ